MEAIYSQLVLMKTQVAEPKPRFAVFRNSPIKNSFAGTV